MRKKSCEKHAEVQRVHIHIYTILDNTLLQRLEEDGHKLTPEQRKFVPLLTPTHSLMFATGACGIPAIGFDPAPSCCFVHDDSKAIPCAQTCSNMLCLYVNNKTAEGDCLNYFLTALMNGGIVQYCGDRTAGWKSNSQNKYQSPT